MPSHLRRAVIRALLIVVALPLPLRADPITVTSGNVQVETSLLLARISLAGDRFAVSTGAEDFFSDLRFCVPCEPNAPVNLGASWRPTSINGGTATVNGVRFPELFFGPGSSGTFTTPSVTLTGSAPTTVTVPFTFKGTITGFASQELNDPVFTASLVGSGTARARFVPIVDSSGPLFNAVDLPGTDFQLEYTFSRVSATPEPGTLLLIGAGALVLEARRRRRLH